MEIPPPRQVPAFFITVTYLLHITRHIHKQIQLAAEQYPN